MRSSTNLIVIGSVLWIIAFVLAVYACDPVTLHTVDHGVMQIATVFVALGFMVGVAGVILKVAD